LAIPFLIYLSFKKKYKYSIPSRFFLKKNKPFKNGGIWFHACSLGEVVSLEAIIENLKDYKVDLSVTTQTGYVRAKKIKSCTVRYLPFEIFLPFWVRRHRTLVVTEAELWPMLFASAKLKGMKTILINARISDNSYNGYKKLSWFYKWVFSNIDEIFAQSEADRHRLSNLGAKNIKIIGNIKSFSKPTVSRKYTKPQKRVIIVASSHEKEEELVLENLKLGSNDILIVAPRHPERFSSVYKYLEKFSKQKNLSFARLSEEKKISKDIILCDLMGELINLYAISDVVILCGSFLDGIGGHNPIECAYFNTKIISGPHVFNQKALFSLVENIKICEAKDLKDINYDDLKESKVIQTKQMEELLGAIKS
jgi:3-deoxy-D-manno-octulosonic-acid transferase